MVNNDQTLSAILTIRETTLRAGDDHAGAIGGGE